MLEAEVEGHPLATVYLEEIQIAKDILNGELQTIKTVVAEQHGDRNAHASQNLKFGFGDNFQSTGIVALAGKEITVYVDAEPGQPLPQLVFHSKKEVLQIGEEQLAYILGKCYYSTDSFTK